jgi:multicomponent Na+:H+ antiporter subunit G
MIIIELLSTLIISLGCVVMFSAALGLYRFPDIYMRLQSIAKTNTGGAFTILIGLLLRCGVSAFSAKIFVIMILMIVLPPLISHTIARSAHLQKIAKSAGEKK